MPCIINGSYIINDDISDLEHVDGIQASMRSPYLVNGVPKCIVMQGSGVPKIVGPVVT